MAPILKIEQITKRFPGVLANNCIDLEIEEGEIHALLGENGAGKTTLMNIIYGLYQPQDGIIYFQNRPVKINSPLEAINLGIGMVHQHFMLIPVFTVAENVILGLNPTKGFGLDLDPVMNQIKDLSKNYGLDVDPGAYVWQLSVGMQQRVEILKALYRNAKLLILDEPTAVLTPQESRDLFKILRNLASQGTSIIFISHKLNEAMAISDRVTVLRDGCVVDTVNTKDTNTSALARMMVGHEVFLRMERPPVKRGKPVLVVDNLSAPKDRGSSKLKVGMEAGLNSLNGISFTVHEGEILGLAGVDGNGQHELSEVLTGTRKVSAGSITVQKKNLVNKKPMEFIRNGISCIPQDRKRVGSVGEFSLAENSILKTQGSKPFAHHGFLNWKNIYQFTDHLISKFDVRSPNAKVQARTLSGGNLQKLIFGREIEREHQVLIAMQPTRGLDVAAMESVYRFLLEERSKGTAILLISTELDEIFTLSDRIAVIYEGNLIGEVTADEADIERIGLLMAGMRDTGDGVNGDKHTNNRVTNNFPEN